MQSVPTIHLCVDNRRREYPISRSVGVSGRVSSPLRDARRPVYERINELGDLSTALPAQARLDDSIKEPRECEVLLRSEIKESFLQSGIGSAFRSGASSEGLGTVDLNTPEFFSKLAAINAEVFAKVGEVFDDVKEECEEVTVHV